MDFSFSIKDRAVNAFQLPFVVAENGLKSTTFTLLGVAASALESLSFGQIAHPEYTAKWTLASKDLLTKTFYRPILKVVNPSAKFSATGGTFSCITGAILFKARHQARSDNFFKKHVISRVLLLTHIPLSVATRAADLALGILGAGVSIATLGTSAKINGFALAHLESTKLIDDICTDIRAILNPNPLNILMQQIRARGNY